MKIYHNIEEVGRVKNAVVTVGTFDGVHKGHRKLINEVCRKAKAIGGESVIVTFDPLPRRILKPREDIKMISTLEEKIEAFSRLCVDHLLIIRFTCEFAKTSGEDFLKKYIIEPFGLKAFVIGYDHHFGNDRQGDIEFLTRMSKKYAFDVDRIAEEKIDDTALSSSKIREAILKGDMPTANAFLGYRYSMSGIVVKGNQLGRKLGFPTANIEPEYGKLIPAYGVYAVLVKWNNKLYGGMSNIGIRPTLKEHQLTVEVNIFDFNHNIYGEKITIYFVQHTREEKKFRDLELLRRRLIIDKIKVSKILENIL